MTLNFATSRIKAALARQRLVISSTILRWRISTLLPSLTIPSFQVRNAVVRHGRMQWVTTIDANAGIDILMASERASRNHQPAVGNMGADSANQTTRPRPQRSSEESLEEGSPPARDSFRERVRSSDLSALEGGEHILGMPPLTLTPLGSETNLAQVTETRMSPMCQARLQAEESLQRT